MNDDNQRQEDATTIDLSRPVATADDSDYSLSVEEVLARYEAAGFPRTPRSIQRYCRKGYLEARRAETPFGEKFLIKGTSVDRHIAYIRQVQPVATSRDMSGQDATDEPAENEGLPAGGGASASDDSQRQSATTDDRSRPVAAQNEPLSRVVAPDVRVVELLERENEFLRNQIVVKDEQIKDLAEHARSTNIVIAAITRKLPLLGTRDDARGAEDSGGFRG